MKHALRTTLATLALAGLTACSDAAPEPAALEAEALVASAAGWTPAVLTTDLPVDDATRQRIEDGLRDLHESLVALDGRELTREDAEAIHAKHAALWDSLDPEVRDLLAARLHERMRAHDGDAMESLHERMRALHGGVHDAADAGDAATPAAPGS